jgi:hypothetical protein
MARLLVGTLVDVFEAQLLASFRQVALQSAPREARVFQIMVL